MNLNNLFDSMAPQQPMNEGRVKELEMDIVDPDMSDSEFATKYEDSRENMARELGMTQDRKTGRFYNPDQEFDRLRNSPEFGAQMRRMAQQDGVAEGSEYKSRHAHKQEQDKAYADYRTKHATSSMALMTRAEFAKDQRERAAKKKQGVAEATVSVGDTVWAKHPTQRYKTVTGKVLHTDAKSTKIQHRDGSTSTYPNNDVSNDYEELNPNPYRKKEQGVAEGPVVKKPQPYNVPDWAKNLPKEKLDALAGKKHKTSSGVAETALQDKADLVAKRRALQDLSRDSGVDQQAVQQRQQDLEKEAKAKDLAENSLQDRLKKYVRPVVKTTPKIERTTNPAGRTTDHVEWKVTGPMGDVSRFTSKKAAQAHYDSFGQHPAEHFESDQPKIDPACEYFTESRAAKRAAIQEIMLQSR